MANTFKTPGVYIQEVSTLPASIVPVETAIPAFIGYTEKADENAPKDLIGVPTKIKSLLEYKELFGGGPSLDITSVTLDGTNAVQSSDIAASFYMYDSLQLFFANGGADCYIVSVGTYKDKKGNTSKADFIDTGIKKLKKYDEPTLILFPDAVLLEDDLYAVQQQALIQCEELQDRFCVFDMLEFKAADATFDWEDGYKAFRNGIGANNLKYGAAYTPWLKTSLEKTIRFRDLDGKIFRGGAVLDIKNLTTEKEIQDTLLSLRNTIKDVNVIDTDVAALMGADNSLKQKYVTLVDGLKATQNKTNFQKLFDFIYNVVDKVDDWAATTVLGNFESKGLKTDIKAQISDALKAAMVKLVDYDLGATANLTGTYDRYTNKTFTSTEWGTTFSAPPATTTTIYSGATEGAKMINAEPHITTIFENVNTVVQLIVDSAKKYESNFEDSIEEFFPVYKNIITVLNKELCIVPPSGAVVGQYASVDDERGVHKAPANVSLNSVTGLTETIDDDEQEDLNVHTDGGKSLNVIRAFTGKGILIWGARTLAGNDNEWRYVPVRRFFIFVEESVKKATAFSVFEPNDANTWIKLKSMIENFLTDQWRQGALAGSKPEQAFFVNVGLGVTMTPQDILEGRLIIEIGMAAVRPAEFIILRFSHKLQEA